MEQPNIFPNINIIGSTLRYTEIELVIRNFALTVSYSVKTNAVNFYID